jgi:hypothetical protein
MMIGEVCLKGYPIAEVEIQMSFLEESTLQNLCTPLVFTSICDCRTRLSKASLWSKSHVMKLLSSNLIILSFAVLISCKKESVVRPPVPTPEPVVEMLYTNLNNAEVKYSPSGVWVDLDNDNRPEVLFEVMLVGDFINKKDMYRFNIVTSIRTNVPVNINEQIPVFLKGATIRIENFEGTNWYGASEITLMEKVVFENSAVVWRGNWLTVQKSYLPVQLNKNGKWHNGWIELTADHQNEKLILHRAAISKEPEKIIKAGL